MTIRTALLFGGRSAEHDVSILSARSVANAAPRDRVEIIPMCIARDGGFVSPERSGEILAGENSDQADADFSFDSWWRGANADVVFPLIHGTGGEDGTLQGYLETIGAPYVGSGVAASAVGMDKGHMKHAFATAKLPIVEYVLVSEVEWRRERERVTRALNNTLRLPYFVKPANSGSSVGVTKVKNDKDLEGAMEFGFRFDDRVLVERGVDAREMEISVLGNEQPQASVPGEILAGHDFYDYEDKYAPGATSSLVIPAKLPKDRVEDMRRLAIGAFRAIGASGFARVDFFLEKGTNRVLVNEINTIPGFTNISMYPKLWEATEIKYSRLIERLIELGLERHRARLAKRDGAMDWLKQARKIT
ncbi:MAG: D-alanine--D-alanine ligase [Thermoanaerobaculia bacterium]